MKFKVGDRVRLIESLASFDKNAEGEIYEIDGHSIGVCFDIKRRGHDLGNYGKKCEYGRGWYVQENDIELIKTESEVPMKDIKYGVKYDRDTDPVEFFKSKPQAKKRIQELLDDPEVKKESIYLFQVGKVEKVQRLQNFELVKV